MTTSRGAELRTRSTSAGPIAGGHRQTAYHRGRSDAAKDMNVRHVTGSSGYMTRAAGAYTLGVPARASDEATQ